MAAILQAPARGFGFRNREGRHVREPSMAEMSDDTVTTGRTPTYVSDQLFEGVRVLGPEASEAHLGRLRRALAKRGLAPRQPPTERERQALDVPAPAAKP